MKNLKTIYLVTLMLLSSILLINCENQNAENEIETSVAVKDLSKRLDKSIIKSKELGKNIALEYLKKTKSKSISKTEEDIATLVYDSREAINEIILEDFPEFEIVSNSSVEEFRTIFDINRSHELINSTELSQNEKEFMNSIVSASIEGDLTKINTASKKFENYLNSTPLSSSEFERGKAMLDLQISLFNQFNTDLLSKAEDCSVAKGALASAMVGAAYGFIKGCWTGLIFGWNPGSVAAGCIGGMIVGMVEGAVLGAVGSAVACAI